MTDDTDLCDRIRAYIVGSEGDKMSVNFHLLRGDVICLCKAADITLEKFLEIITREWDDIEIIEMGVH